MIRGRIGERPPPFGDTIYYGDPVWRHCKKCDKYFDRKTGEEIKVEKLTFDELMEEYGHKCNEAPAKDKAPKEGSDD